jgi:PleD family two-component response regulator
MHQILWVDDDSDDFMAVDRAITRRDFELVTMFSIADAVQWLKDTPEEPAALVLDAIVPLGGFTPKHQDSPRKEVLEIYTGFLILEEFPHLASKTIVVSVVWKSDLEKAGLLKPDIKFFSKLDLGPQLQDFEKSLPEVGH